MRTIDLNADLGEGGLQDAALIPLVSSVNIACGGHAGNNETIRACVDAALASACAIGAHPGYEDPDYFGRRHLSLSDDALRGQIRRQLERIRSIHPELHHVKPHGALYNQANCDPHLAMILCQTIAESAPAVLLYAPPHGELVRAANACGLTPCGEGFMDRRYLADGSLCPRNGPNALIHDPTEAAAQAMVIIERQQVVSIDGPTLALPVRTLCVHGDTPEALEQLRNVHAGLIASAIAIRPA